MQEMQRDFIRRWRDAKRVALRNAASDNTRLIQRVKESYAVVSEMATKCCYCGVMVPLPYTWIVNLKTNSLEAVIDVKNKKRFYGWDSPFPGWPGVNLLHPHVSGVAICTGHGDTAFTGPTAAVDALTTGLNPASPHFKIKPWLHAVGHRCEQMGDFCPEHGYDEARQPERIIGPWIEAARWNCEPISRVWNEKYEKLECPYCLEERGESCELDCYPYRYGDDGWFMRCGVNGYDYTYSGRLWGFRLIALNLPGVKNGAPLKRLHNTIVERNGWYKGDRYGNDLWRKLRDYHKHHPHAPLYDGSEARVSEILDFEPPVESPF